MHTSTGTYSKHTRWNTCTYYGPSQTEVAVGVESSHCGRKNQTSSSERHSSTWGRNVPCGIMWLANRLAGRKRRTWVGLGRWASCSCCCGHQWPSEARFKGINKGSSKSYHQTPACLAISLLSDSILNCSKLIFFREEWCGRWWSHRQYSCEAVHATCSQGQEVVFFSI